MPPPKLVVCGGLPPPRKKPLNQVIQLDTNLSASDENRVFLRFDTLTEQLLDNVEPIVADALEIAAYVFMADRMITRGADTMARMGDQWRRKVTFQIPVRRPETWNDQEIQDALTGALAFLSEDDFTFEFERGDPALRLDPFLGFDDPSAQKFRPDDVMLFSGGLDSLGGAVESLRERGKVVLVTHKNSNNLAKRQDALVDKLRERSAGRLFYAPVWVRRGNYDPVEYTQRTRSFLFAALGVALARMFDRRTVHFFENGITSFNLPIAEHVIGTRASRTTHPRTLAAFANLFSLLLQKEFKFENDFLWLTKKEVVAGIHAGGCADLLDFTTSCANVRNMAMTTKQCGVCSQCVERRFAILAAGLKEFEADDTYALDLFIGAHNRVEDITMVEQYVSRAARFSAMTDHAFLGAYGQVFRALASMPGDRAENARRIFELHQRYGRDVVTVVDRELQENAGLARILNMPPTSLIAMINSYIGGGPVRHDPSANELPASAQTHPGPTAGKHKRFVFAVDETSRVIRFEDGPTLAGKNFEFLSCLLSQFREDTAAGKSPDHFIFTPTQDLIKLLRVEEHTLAQRVFRLRAKLREQFLAADYMIDDDDVVQSESWHGYRLNPFLVEAVHLGVRARRSALSSPPVISRQHDP